MKHIKSIYPRFFKLKSPQMLSFMHDLSTPLKRPTFQVDLIDCNESTSEINYKEIPKMDCLKIGTHIKEETI